MRPLLPSELTGWGTLVPQPVGCQLSLSLTTGISSVVFCLGLWWLHQTLLLRSVSLFLESPAALLQSISRETQRRWAGHVPTGRLHRSFLPFKILFIFKIGAPTPHPSTEVLNLWVANDPFTGLTQDHWTTQVLIL